MSQRILGIVLTNGRKVEAPLEVWLMGLIQTMPMEQLTALAQRVDEIQLSQKPAGLVGLNGGHGLQLG